MKRAPTEFEGMLQPPAGVTGVPDESGSPATALPPHGQLHTGLGTSADGGTTEHPHIWIWIEPAAQAPCQEYRFYQFFKPAFYILDEDELDADGNRRDEAEAETNLPELTPPTGVRLRFNRWNPDYHREQADAENRQRRRDGKPRLPRHRPSHLTPPAGGPKHARPFVQYGVPGSNPDGTTPLPGLCDGPRFNRRGDDLAPVEFLFLEKTRPRRATGARPPSGSALVEVSIEFETCLVCVDDGEYDCLQCLRWTYSEHSTLRTEWVAAPASGGIELGSPDDEDHWQLATEITESTVTIDIGEWSPCQ